MLFDKSLFDILKLAQVDNHILHDTKEFNVTTKKD
jgi:hypothetical protein